MFPGEEDHSVKALGFDRSLEALGVRIQVRALRRKLDAMNAGCRERLGELRRVQRVTIMDEITFPDEEAVKAVRQIPRLGSSILRLNRERFL